MNFHVVRTTRHRARQQQQPEFVGQGPLCHHRAQGSSVNPFGYPPLSNDRPSCSGIGERGIFPQYIPISPPYMSRNDPRIIQNNFYTRQESSQINFGQNKFKKTDSHIVVKNKGFCVLEVFHRFRVSSNDFRQFGKFWFSPIFVDNRQYSSMLVKIY